MPRIIIDTDNQDIVEGLKNNENVEIITSYDPVERLTARVEKMRIALMEFKQQRGSWRILNYYLRGRGLNQNEIDKVLQGVEEFMGLV